MNVDSLVTDAEAIVARATKAGASDVEVYLETGASLEVELESGRLAGSGRSSSSGGSVRVIHDGRVGFAYFTKLEKAESAIDQAMQLSRLAPKTNLVMPEPEKLAPIGQSWFDDVASLESDAAIASAKEIIAGVDTPEATISGGVSMGWGASAIANSRGVGMASKSTMMQGFASLVLPSGDSNINAWDASSSHGQINGRDIGAAAAKTVLSLRDAKPATAGKADLVLLPTAGSELVTGVVLGAIDGDSATRGKSFWSDKLGQQVAHEGLSILDTPLDKRAIGGCNHDDEGRAVRNQPLLEDGVLKTFLFNGRDAAKHGAKPTGHAVRDGFKSPPGTGAHHVAVEAKATESLDKLIGGIDRGYLVESVLGAHTANGTTGDFSVTAPNVWRIEGGAVAHACKEIAIGGNLPSMLMHFDAVGDTPKAMSGARIPPMRFRDVQVSV